MFIYNEFEAAGPKIIVFTMIPQTENARLSRGSYLSCYVIIFAYQVAKETQPDWSYLVSIPDWIAVAHLGQYTIDPRWNNPASSEKLLLD